MESIPQYLFSAGHFVADLSVPLVMVIAMVAFAWPALRGTGELTPPRFAAATVLGLMCLLNGLFSLPSALSGSAPSLIRAGLLIIPALFILVRLQRTGGYGGY